MWYPLPLAVGALLLVALQYRHKLARAEKEVHVDDKGQEVIKLKGPWQVRAIYIFRPGLAQNLKLTGPCAGRFTATQCLPGMGISQFV
jgi:hypothetical protein